MGYYIDINGTDYDTDEFAPISDRTFREAWVMSAGIEVDMPKARDIWRDKIREARKPELEKLDVEFMKALETGADTTAIAQKRQVLRDAPNLASIEAAATPDELKAIQPIPNITVE